MRPTGSGVAPQTSLEGPGAPWRNDGARNPPPEFAFVKHALAVFLLTLVAYTLTASGHLYTPDGEIMYRTTRSLAEEGDLDIEAYTGFATRSNERGQEYAQYGVGQPLLAVPFYLAGAALADSAPLETWARLYGTDEASAAALPRPAIDLATRFAVSWFNIVVGALTAFFLCLLLIRLTGHPAASAFAAALYALGSMAWPHSRPYYSESLAVFFMIVAWWALLRAIGIRGLPLAAESAVGVRGPAAYPGTSDEAERAAAPLPRKRWAALLIWCAIAGAATGYAFLVRMDSVLMYPGTACLLLGPVRRAAGSTGRVAAAWAAFSLPALACLGVFLTLNTLHFGGPFEVGYSDQPEGVQFSTPMLAGLFGFLFSVGKGLFFFSPVLVLGLFGWPELFRRSRWIFWGLLLVIILPLLVMSKWINWAGGWTWGPRHIFMIHPFLILPAAVWLAAGWVKARRAPALILLVVGVGVQLLGVSQDFMEFHQRFYRDPAGTYRVVYDEFDEEYWGQYFVLMRTTARANEVTPVPLSRTPAPIYLSLYVPQASVWGGYPRMFRETKTIDNLWYRMLMRDGGMDAQSPATGTVAPPQSPNAPINEQTPIAETP